jgi:putative Mg2+ transporter-C (MgtC) family protein
MDADFFADVARDFAQFLDWNGLTHAGLRLSAAALLGGLLGYQREVAGKDAGLRTYMLVSVGAAFFIIVPQRESFANEDLSRVLQGLLTGIGFLGAGAILKLSDEHEVRGLTTAAGIWLAAAIGAAAGFGQLGLATLVAVVAFFILGIPGRVEHKLAQTGRSD